MAAHTCPFAVRMREASSRPKREYKPKAREPFDLGEPEQSNGGFPCTPAPTITGNRSKGPRCPRASEQGRSIQTVGRVPPDYPAEGAPRDGTRPHPLFSAYLCALCASSFVVFPLF